MSNLSKRILTALVLVPAIGAGVSWGGPTAIWGIVFLVTLLASHEALQMLLPAEAELQKWLGVLFAALISISLYWSDDAFTPIAALCCAIITLFAVELGRGRNLETVGTRMGLTLLGPLYVGLLLTPLAILGRRPEGADWVYLVLTITFFGDTVAYFTGCAFGREKLLPSVSPGKTVEGAGGGLAGAVAAFALAKLWYMPQLAWLDLAAMALPAAMLAQVGDLCASMLKRSSGVKDSGGLLPGHGGMLDRIDGLLFSSPYVYFYAHWIYYVDP